LQPQDHPPPHEVGQAREGALAGGMSDPNPRVGAGGVVGVDLGVGVVVLVGVFWGGGMLMARGCRAGFAGSEVLRW